MFDFKGLNELLNVFGTNGFFLTAGKDKPNSMTVGWGMVGVMFRKKVVVMPVRKSRYTKEIMDKEDCFSISIPKKNMDKELIYFGNNSGRDVDKYKEMNVSLEKCRNIDTSVIKECGYFIECKKLAVTELTTDFMDEKVKDTFYKANTNNHFLFIGEVIEEYEK